MIEGTDGKKDRKRCRIYVKAAPLPFEVSVSDPHPDLKGLAPGAPLRIQMETPPDDPSRATVRRVLPRDGGTDFDVIPRMWGIIDHVNEPRGLAHVIIAKGLDGKFRLSDLTGPTHPGRYVSVRAARYHSRQGPGTRILAVSPTTEAPDPNVCRSFSESVRVHADNGFTTGGVYIPRDLVAIAGIRDGDHVEGLAVINYNKTKGEWSWKAAIIEAVVPGSEDPA